MPKNQQEPHKIQAWSLINRKYLGQGVRVKRFRRPKRSQIRNRVLLAVLMAKDIKLSKLAEELSVSSRSVSAWVYEGRMPATWSLTYMTVTAVIALVLGVWVFSRSWKSLVVVL